MTPRHHDPTDRRPRRDAKAPYNFVPLPDAIATIEDPPRQDRYDENLLTGKLVCTLTTASPLYVRAAQRVKEEYEAGIAPSAHAYGENEEDLIIPGSSLRGMLRTMVEIISYSKLAPVTDQRLFFRTVDDTSVGKSYNKRMRDKVRGGFFHQDKDRAWIEPCYLLRVEDTTLSDMFSNGLYDGNPPNQTPKPSVQHRKVYLAIPTAALENPGKIFTTEDIQLEPVNGLIEGTLVITGPMHNKEHEFIFVRSSAAKEQVIELSEEMVERFHDDDQITRWQGLAFPQGKGRRNHGWLKDGDPVFYLPGEDGEEVEFFGRAYMFRLPYIYSPQEMLPQALREYQGLDLAEAMFGLVPQSQSERSAIAGRIFVMDAKLVGDGKEALFESPVVFSTQALSSPKPTAIQHYLTQRYPDHKNKLDHYDNDPETESTLRGHKLYWHTGSSDAVTRRLDKAIKPRTPADAKDFRPVKADQKFTFQIHFENLRPVELGALLWVLDVADHPNYRLKLGMGKPFGLGSIAIHAEPNLSDRQVRYESIFKGDSWNEGWLPDDEREQKTAAAIKAFAGWLLSHEIINPEKKCKHLSELKRIQELLALLSWPGPDPERTDYMTLKEFAGQEGGYDSRPVLPTPAAVLDDQLPDTSPEPPEEDEPEYIDRDVSDAVEEWQRITGNTGDTGSELADIPQPLSKAPSELAPGDVIHAVVDDAPAKGDIYLIPEIHGPEDYCLISPEYRGSRRYKVGEEMLVIVISLDGDDENGWEILCRPWEV